MLWAVPLLCLTCNFRLILHYPNQCSEYIESSELSPAIRNALVSLLNWFLYQVPWYRRLRRGLINVWRFTLWQIQKNVAFKFKWLNFSRGSRYLFYLKFIFSFPMRFAVRSFCLRIITASRLSKSWSEEQTVLEMHAISSDGREIAQNQETSLFLRRIDWVREVSYGIYRCRNFSNAKLETLHPT